MQSPRSAAALVVMAVLGLLALGPQQEVCAVPVTSEQDQQWATTPVLPGGSDNVDNSQNNDTKAISPGARTNYTQVAANDSLMEGVTTTFGDTFDMDDNTTDYSNTINITDDNITDNTTDYNDTILYDSITDDNMTNISTTAPMTSLPEGVLPEDVITSILNTHNKLRGYVQPTASNMQPLVWNERLAAAAYQFSLQCGLHHDVEPEIEGFDLVGVNVGAVGAKRHDFANSIERSWYAQRIRYSYETNKCTTPGTCSSYTQMVWAESTSVGCGSTLCYRIQYFPVPHSILFTCFYETRGNPDQQPYKKGPPCTSCRLNQTSCSDNVCSVNVGVPTSQLYHFLQASFRLLLSSLSYLFGDD